MLWHWFALPLFAGLHWTLLMLSSSDDALALVNLAFLANLHVSWFCRKKCTKEFVIFWQLYRLTEIGKSHGFFWIKLLLLICEWCLWVSYCCWLYLVLLISWQGRLKLPHWTTSKQVNIPLCPVNLSTTSGGWWAKKEFKAFKNLSSSRLCKI